MRRVIPLSLIAALMTCAAIGAQGSSPTPLPGGAKPVVIVVQ